MAKLFSDNYFWETMANTVKLFWLNNDLIMLNENFEKLLKLGLGDVLRLFGLCNLPLWKL